MHRGANCRVPKTFSSTPRYALRLNLDALLEAKLDASHLLPIQEGIALECEECGSVALLETADTALREDRPRSRFTPHLEQ